MENQYQFLKWSRLMRCIKRHHSVKIPRSVRYKQREAMRFAYAERFWFGATYSYRVF